MVTRENHKLQWDFMKPCEGKHETQNGPKIGITPKCAKTHVFLANFEDVLWPYACFALIASGRRASHCYQRHHVNSKHEIKK